MDLYAAHGDRASLRRALYAALDTKSGEVIGKTASRHTSEEFVGFVLSIVVSQPKGKEIYIILDNLSAHKTQRI